MNRALPWLTGAALLISGCASAPPPPAGPPSAGERTGSAETLVIERQWLETWFRGTPVVITQRADGGFDVDIPRDFCFEPGKSKVMPALAAVLDKVAESLRRATHARVALLAAPGDAAGASPLATQRASQVAAELRSRGVAAVRIGNPTVSSIAAVRLRLQSSAT